MIRFDIISAVPGLLESPFAHSILMRAREKGLAEIVVHNLRDYGLGAYRQIDDYQYGGGAGMVMMPEPLFNCISDLQKERDYDEIIYLTPDGERFDQRMANQLSLKKNMMLICGHYKGIDQRIRDHLITKEITIGDFVLSGGELPAAVIVDAVVRLVPGVIGDETSALFDSYQDNLLAPPVYTRPENFNGWKVPDILLSGHEAKINEWRHRKAVQRTQDLRPDLLDDD